MGVESLEVDWSYTGSPVRDGPGRVGRRVQEGRNGVRKLRKRSIHNSIGRSTMRFAFRLLSLSWSSFVIIDEGYCCEFAAGPTFPGSIQAKRIP